MNEALVESGVRPRPPLHPCVLPRIVDWGLPDVAVVNQVRLSSPLEWSSLEYAVAKWPAKDMLRRRHRDVTIVVSKTMSSLRRRCWKRGKCGLLVRFRLPPKLIIPPRVVNIIKKAGQQTQRGPALIAPTGRTRASVTKNVEPRARRKRRHTRIYGACGRAGGRHGDAQRL
jgi:hypothetical protein